MSMQLSQLRGWLDQQYQPLGLKLDTVPTEHNPLWVDIGGNAQLLDPQVGIWMLFYAVEAGPAASSAVEEAMREGLDQVSRLDPKSSVNEANADPYGPWQVHVVWLVADETRDAWESALAEMRARSSHAEEVGMDAVFVPSGRLREALDEQGLPALLLRSRALLNLPPDDLPRWLSPDHAFETALRQIPSGLTNAEDRQHAQQFIDERVALHRRTSQLADGDQVAVPELAPLEIEELRNIAHARLDLTSSSDDALHVNVTHGPNGTGKSSLFEALSLALFGTSRRLREYITDPDIKPGDKSRYADKVLRRFGATSGARVRLGGADRLATIATTVDLANERDALASGTLLAQEVARDFVTLSAGDRGAMLLSDYSQLASLTQQGLDEKHSDARASWQDTLRGLGLTASITKRETIYKRLARRLIDEKVPPGSDSTANWLKTLGNLRPEFRAEADALSSRWMRLDAPAGREGLAEQFDAGLLVAETGQQTLANWLEARQDACRDVQAFEARIAPLLQSIRQEWERARGDLETWANWSTARRQRARTPGESADTPPTASSADPVTDDTERKIAENLRELEVAGKLLRAQVEHLQDVQATLLPTWQEKHPYDCPTCGQKHSDQIADIVARLADECEEKLRSTRESYKEQDAKLKALRDRRAAADRPPVTVERQAEIAALLNLPVEGLDSLSSRMGSQPQAWQELLRPLSTLMSGPMLPKEIDAAARKSVADELIAALSKEIAITEQQRTAPDRWAQLKKRVDDSAVKVLQEHLPRTIEAVWREIALALGPARWNQPAQAEMKLDQQRGAARLGLVLRSAKAPGSELPVRHVLNQAEQHVVGLGWFFTRHLTHGRHLTPLIALDDPAQEMDQKTFRQFVRFLQAFCRLHRSTSRRLTLIAFLHQEDRALELARAVQPDARLTMLSWSRAMRLLGPDANAREIRLRNPEQRAPRPLPLRSMLQASVKAAS
jgi:hypothetical protein